MLALLPFLTLLQFSNCQDQSLAPIFVPGPEVPITNPELNVHEFTLRHIFHHGTHRYPDLHRRLDVSDPNTVQTIDPTGARVAFPSKLRARSEPLRIQRLKDRSQQHLDYILDTGRERGEPLALDASFWTLDEVKGPNVTDKDSVLAFARISANAYVGDSSDPGWFNIGNGFNSTNDFGWENDGLRGHIFADEKNGTVIVGIKGTSPAVFDGEGTTHNDKVNDNLFFSCCCGQGGKYGWLQVCDCQTDPFVCNSTCVVHALKSKNRYYYAAQEIYRNVSAIYPDADIWLVGHSLGGATASLVALTYGIPVVTFEAPGEAMPAKRLGLPTPPGYHLGAHQQRISTGGFHFGHTADPIFMGTCNTYSSVCTIAGYAMQSVCHTGATCVFDTVGDLGWRVGAGTHKIVSVIRDVLEKYDEPAVCLPYSDCTDCFEWTFFESNNTHGTTIPSTSTAEPTRTSTCKTPGWFGCNDDPTSTVVITTTTTCKTPGWLGCDDPTSTVTTTTTQPTTTSCKTPGWFGSCKDKTTAITTTTTVTVYPTTTADPEPSVPTTSICQTPGWFGCNDPTTTSKPAVAPSKTSSLPSSTSTEVASRTTSPPKATSTKVPADKKCLKYNWLGWCTKWESDDQDRNLEL